MTVATFDFTNLRIILPVGDVSIEVERDLYSAWKRAVLLSSANMSAPPAFRPSVGGDSLSPGIESGAYFFFQNQDGWRIRPAEADATVTFTGNLAAEDPALPMTVPTIGAFTVLINGLQPITQSVSELLLEQQNATYEGVVHINTFTGTAGTTFPIGTASTPSSNIADALTILNSKGFSRVALVGPIVLPSAFTFKQICGQIGVASVDVNGQNVSGTKFEEVAIFGDFSAVNPATPAAMFRCVHVGPVLNFVGNMGECLLGPTLSLVAGKTNINRCASNVAGAVGTPIVDCQGNIVDVSFRGYDGGLEIRNFSNALNHMSVDSEALRLVLGPTVTNGDIVVRGTGEIEDASGPAASVNTEGFVDAEAARRDRLVIDELRKLMRNKMITDPVTGILTIFDDDGATVLFRANIFEDATGLVAYRGKGAERREKLELLGVFGPEFGLEFG